MTKLIVWSPAAERDFNNILQYINEKWDTKTTNHFIDLTERILSQILTNPRQFPVISKEKKVRKCIITMHNSLYYRAHKNQIRILRIFDNRQDPKNLIL